MKERGILFSAPMVRAILEGRKTMTRRVVKDQAFDMTGLSPEIQNSFENAARNSEFWAGFVRSCHHGQPGDQLYVRETFYAFLGWKVLYRADDDGFLPDDGWRPSIHMPRWASRITLEITSVRVERLQDISTEDCIAEGVSTTLRGHDAEVDMREQFRKLWNSTIIGREIERYGWNANPWVWVVEFKVVQA